MTQSAMATTATTPANNPNLESEAGTFGIRLRRDNEQFVFDAHLPDIDPESTDITVDGEWLTIRAERSTQTENLQHHATIVRRVSLGLNLDPDSVEATYQDPTLTLTVRPRPTTRRRIPVRTLPPAESGAGDGSPSSAPRLSPITSQSVEPRDSWLRRTMSKFHRKTQE